MVIPRNVIPQKGLLMCCGRDRSRLYLLSIITRYYYYHYIIVRLSRQSISLWRGGTEGRTRRMSSQQQQEEEEPRSWQQQQQQTSSGGAGAGNSSSAGGTPIRRTDNKSSVRLSEFIPAGSSSEWRHLTSSPSRIQQQQQRSSARNSPHCWSSENLLAGANNKDSSGMTASWTPAGSDQSGSAQGNQPTGVQGGVEPFIPPPPLLDFETANLLPPLGVDVSSPSDDLHFMPVSGADGAVVGQESGGVNWVQIPSQYATLRRPRSNNGNGN